MIKLKKYLLKNFNVVKINSNDIKKGDVFIALKGEKNHGSQYIVEAINNGARYIITDIFFNKEGVKSEDNKVVVVKNTLDFLLKIAKEKRKLYKGKVVGITGSIGKTSVKENLKYFLSSTHKVYASIKSYNNYLGIIISLLNLDLKSHFALFEIGTSDFLEIKKLSSIVIPSQVIITNIFPTHLEKFINTRNIALEKSDIFHPKYSPGVKLVILSNYNIDEKFIIKNAKKLNSLKIMTFGRDVKSDITINNIKKIDDIFSFIEVIFENKKIELTIHNNQLHRINNILICLLFFIHNIIKLDFFLSSTKNLPLLEGRGLHNQIILDNNRKIYFIDESYNASPQTMKKCVDYFLNLKTTLKQKKIIILGEMRELGDNSLSYHIDLINYLLEKKIKNVIICGKLMQIAKTKIGNNNIPCKLNLESILEYINTFVQDNDIVLIKGSNSSITNQVAKYFLNKGVN